VPKTPEARIVPLVELIYRAAVVPDLWTEFLEALSDELDTPTIAMNLEVPGAPSVRRVYRVNSPARFGRVFGEFAMRGEIPWDLSQVSGTRFHPASELIPDDELLNTAFYREYMEPQGLSSPIGLNMGFVDGVLVATIGIYPRVRARKLDGADREMLDLLAPHLGHAYRIHRRLRSLEQYRDAANEVMDRIPTGVIFVDGGGKHVASNRTAGRILALRDGLESREGTPYATASRVRRDFEAMLAVSLRPAVSQQEVSQVLHVPRASGRRAFAVLMEHLDSAPTVGNVRDAVAVIFISDPDYHEGGIESRIVSLYGLTAAEAELTLLLSQGKTLEESAEHRGVTMHTARKQLGRVFSKTSTGRQADLVRLIVTGVTNLRPLQEKEGPSYEI
jgi:DNA-binding CsgD family transcriptional regulator